MKGEILESERLILKPLEIKDAEKIIKLATKKVSKYFGAIPYPYKLEDAKKWIKSSSKIESSIDFAIKLKNSDEFIGYIEINGINPKSKVSSISYWIGEKFWRKGYMTEAIKLILNYSFKKKKLNRIYAQINGDNIASQKLLEKIGFKLEGKLRDHIYNRFTKKLEDKYFYGILRSEWRMK